ncbi:MAG: SUMF1/EgtB/PvdO family nonheme iron enzyme [Phycisphaerales bacterium]
MRACERKPNCQRSNAILRRLALSSPALGLVLALASHVTAGILPPSYGHDFVTIGAPGNRATLPDEVPFRPWMQVGAVNYEYRMARTEITGSQWFEFVQAYAPYVGADFGSDLFSSGAIIFRGFGTNGVPTYTMDPIFNNVSIAMGWRYAARYCNWLHNGKALTRDAFENGAYDTATFTNNPDGTVNDQSSRSPGALFWIPSEDEWVKAAYYDPNKHGLGLEGYWRHPGGQDTPLQGGLPGEPGAQTSAPITQPGFRPDVGSYPDVSAPWGLLDVSGGTVEWTETWSMLNRFRIARGSRTGIGSFYYLSDQIDSSGAGLPNASTFGLRIASTVPGAGAFPLLGGLIMVASTRRKRTCEQKYRHGSS